MRIAHVRRCDSQEERRRQPGARSENAPSEHVHEGDGRDTTDDAQRTPGEIDAARIDEELRLERRQRRHETGDPAGGEPGADPREEDVEIERRVEKVVGIEIAGRKGERARHDRDFVGVVDRWQPEGQSRHAQPRREGQHRDERQPPRPLISAGHHERCGGRSSCASGTSRIAPADSTGSSACAGIGRASPPGPARRLAINRASPSIS